MADANAVAQRLEQRLDEQVRKINGAQKTTLILGIVIIVIICGYFSWLISTVNKLMEPATVSEIAMGYVIQTVPELRAEIVKTVEERSDELIEEGIKTAREKLPKARVELEDAAIKEFSALMVELEIQLDELAAYTIDLHKDRVNEWIQYLDTDEEAKLLEQEIFDMLMEPVLESNAHIDLRAYAQTLDGIAEKVELLAKPQQTLTEAEELERQILIALKSVSEREKP